MSRPSTIRLLWLCGGVALLGAFGCGQKGALYLPDHTGAVVTRPAGAGTGGGAQRPATQQPAQSPQTDATTPSPTNPGAAKKDPNKDGDSDSQK